MAKDNIYLSVIIPSYNEMVNLRKGVLDKIDHYLSKQKYSYEVIIVDDGSDDGSGEFAEKFARENKNFRVIKNNHLGKAGAVASGMLQAKGSIRLFTDMDQATPIEETEKLLPLFEKGFDVVIGSRNNTRKGSPLTRRLMSRSMIILRKIMVGIYEIHDTQCGFKAFSEKSAIELFKKINDFHKGFSKIKGSNVTAGFDVELLYLANKMGYRIKEVPVEWLYVETRRVSPVKDSINGLKDLLTISKNKFSGKYNV
ncbi:MAG: glycosyltransferase [Candidatus Levybacteria bacterium]|nr:glycosyltransferase [Candidatus Levybacteria bacterium]